MTWLIAFPDPTLTNLFLRIFECLNASVYRCDSCGIRADPLLCSPRELQFNGHCPNIAFFFHCQYLHHTFKMGLWFGVFQVLFDSSNLGEWYPSNWFETLVTNRFTTNWQWNINGVGIACFSLSCSCIWTSVHFLHFLSCVFGLVCFYICIFYMYSVVYYTLLLAYYIHIHIYIYMVFTINTCNSLRTL